jgi:hypothetical protein
MAIWIKKNVEFKLIDEYKDNEGICRILWFILNYWFKEKVSYIYTFNYHCGQTIFFVTIEYNKTLYNYPLWILLIMFTCLFFVYLPIITNKAPKIINTGK